MSHDVLKLIINSQKYCKKKYADLNYFFSIAMDSSIKFQIQNE